MTLASDASGNQTATHDGTSEQQEAAVASHGLRAPPADDDGSSKSSDSTTTETVHTTANHPWLTSDRGWVAAGDLVAGERVVRADGSTAVVVGLHVVSGSAAMYNLTVSHLHTYAVGDEHYVVHNDCGGPGGAGGGGGGANPVGTVSIPVPEGAEVEPTREPGGILFRRPGTAGNANTVRIMAPSARYPNGRLIYYNGEGGGQPLDALGSPGSRDVTHHSLDDVANGLVPGYFNWLATWVP